MNDLGCLLVLSFGIWGMALAALVIALRTSSRTRDLAADLESARRDIDLLRSRISRRGSGMAAEAPPAEPHVEDEHPETSPVDVAAPVDVPPPPPPAPEELQATMPAPHAEKETPAGPDALPDEAAEAEPQQEPVAAARSLDWESLVGVRLFSWIAGAALVIAAIFFLREAVYQGWLGPTVRMLLGYVTGITVIAIAELRLRERYSFTTHAMDGAGIAILYATTFAAEHLWGLVETAPAFLAMIVITVVAVVLALRRDSLYIAILGILGGFATPALLLADRERAVPLFGYLLLVNAAAAWIGWKKRWPLLSFLSVLLTAGYQWEWVLRYLDRSELTLAAAIFLLAPLATFAAYAASERKGDEALPVWRRVSAFAAVVPLLFALYVAIVPAYGERIHLLFGFLFLVAGGLALTARYSESFRPLHLAGSFSVLLTFVFWFILSWTPGAYPAIVFWVAAFVLLQSWSALDFPRPFDADLRKRASMAGALLFFSFTFLPGLAMETSNPTLLYAVAGSLLVIVALTDRQLGRSAGYAAAASLLIASAAVWLANHADATAIAPSLLLLGALVLLSTLIPMFLSGERKLPLWPASGFAVLLIPVSARAGDDATVALVTMIALAVIVVTIGGTVTAQPAAVGAAAVAAMVSVAVHDSAWGFDAAIAAGLAAIVGGAWWLQRAASGSGGFATASLVAALTGFGVAAASEPNIASDFLGFALLSAIGVVVGWRAGIHRALTVTAAIGSVALLIRAADVGSGAPVAQLAASVAFVVVFLMLPLLSRATVDSRAPWLALVVASFGVFFSLHVALDRSGYEAYQVLVPLSLAAALGLELLLLHRMERDEARDQGRRAVMAGAVLAFVTLAVAVQFDREWLTLALIFEALALSWLYYRTRFTPLLGWIAALLLIGFVRLTLNPAVLSYHERSAEPLFNWYLAVWGSAALASFGIAHLLKKDRGGSAGRLPAAAEAAGTILLFVLLNLEIANYFGDGRVVAFRFSASLASDLTYTIGWATFAIALLVAGIVRDSRAARGAAIALLVVTVVKAFLHDLGRLGGLYRVGSFVGLAVSLAIVALLLQRFVLERRSVKAPVTEA